MAKNDVTAIREQLSAHCVDLVYSTEADSEVEAFAFEGPCSIEALLKHHGRLHEVAPAAFAEFLEKASAAAPKPAPAAQAKAKELPVAVTKLLSDVFAYEFGGNRPAVLIGGHAGHAWTALAPRYDAYQSEFDEVPEIEGVDAPEALRAIATGLALWEPDAAPGELHTTEPLWAVESATARATIVDRTLAQTGFVHVKSETPFDEEGMDDFAPLLGVLGELTDLRTYFVGWSAEWDVYVVGTTKSGDTAGVSTKAVWT